MTLVRSIYLAHAYLLEAAAVWSPDQRQQIRSDYNLHKLVR